MAVFRLVNRGLVFNVSVKLELREGADCILAEKNKYCRQILANDYSNLLFDKEGNPIEDGIVKTNQKATLSLGSVTAKQYHIMLVPNPLLTAKAYVGGPELLEPYEELSLDYFIRAEFPIDLKELNYLFRVYVVD